jgi:hypothetical protein
LQRIERFVKGLQLGLHPGHLLSNVVVGVARALVSLGDSKSQKYAADWLDKIDMDYVQQFESDGIQKVVATLKGAWQRDNSVPGDTAGVAKENHTKRPKL